MRAAEVVPDFIAAMEAAGIAPAEPIADLLSGDRLVRFRVAGDKPGRRNGWARLYLDDRPAGRFGCNRRGVDVRWQSSAPAVRLSPRERRELRERIERERRDRAEALERAHNRLADLAGGRWQGAGDPDPSHPYLLRKRITGEGMRQRGASLLVPLRDDDGKLWNIQSIDGEGGKLFMAGARVAGLSWSVGDPSERVAVGEGVSTMAAVRRATGLPVVAALTWKGLRPVAEAIRARHPRCAMTICADDDAHLVDHPSIKRNIGIEEARTAAAAVGARLALPTGGY